MARHWVAVMQSLTLRDSLRFLTMLTWSEVTAVSNLVHQRKAWCPACYNEWRQAHQVVYEPLLWTLKSVRICPRHRQQLVTVCPHCRTALPFLSQVAHPGYCTRCAGWLGGTSAGEEAVLDCRARRGAVSCRSASSSSAGKRANRYYAESVRESVYGRQYKCPCTQDECNATVLVEIPSQGWLAVFRLPLTSVLYPVDLTSRILDKELYSYACVPAFPPQ